jgi:hypothetical protein
MNNKKKLRLNVLSVMITSTFVMAIICTFIDVNISYILLATSFVIAVFSYFMRIFWSQVKQLKQKENEKSKIY